MTNEAPIFVLDAWAMLAYFRAEPAATRVREILDEAHRGQVSLTMTVVNSAEVFYRTVREFGITRALAVEPELRSFSIQFVLIQYDLAMAAARIKGIHPISYADCLVAALAQRLGATILTGDRDFRRFEGQINVEWLPIP
jgi:predicted nucleic acid-binding protein